MKIASNKIKDIVRFFNEELADIYDKDELESIVVYCFEAYLKIGRAQLNLKLEETVTESELLKFSFAVKELKTHKPIQYVLGEADFYRLKFKVNEHVLIPRPETEELVDLIIKENKGSTVSIIDIGAGSGCIPIALKKNIPSAIVSAIDISEEALTVAKQNAKLNNVEINFYQADILCVHSPDSFLPKTSFDIVVSNPPYICFSEKENMRKNVLDYEPDIALFVNDSNPLLFYEAICDFALNQLNKNGKIYLEINQALGSETKNLLENKGFKGVELIKDLNNNNRILRGSI